MRHVLLVGLLVLVAIGSAVPVAAQSTSPSASPAPVVAPAGPTGHPWQPILGPFADGSEFAEVTAWNRGFAMVRFSETGRPEIWRSTDGRRWRSSPAPRPAGRIAWVRLWASGTGLVQVQATDASLTEVTLTFWRSANGRSWNRAGSLRLGVPPALRACQLNVEGLGETARGIVVVADICRTECCGSISPGVTALAQLLPLFPAEGGVRTWTSPTGQRWTRHRTEGVLTGTLSTITQDGDGLVAVLRGAGPDALVRSSNGIAWRKVGTVPAEVDTANLMGIQPVGSSLLFVGDVPLPPGVTNGNATRIWLVDAGMGWSEVLDLPGTFVFATAGDGDTLLLTGVDQGFLETPDHAWSRLSRDGGETWAVSAGWPGMTDTCFGSVAIRAETAVAATGCTGARSAAPTAWVTRLDAAGPSLGDPSASPAPDLGRPVLAPSLPGPAGDPIALRTKRRADAVVEQDGIRLELWVPRQAIAVGAWLPATLRVTNIGSVPIGHAGSVKDLVCKNPTRAWLDVSRLWTAIPHEGPAAIVADELLSQLAELPFAPTAGLRFTGGCADFGVTERLTPGASFTVPMATWARYPLRDQPVPSGTAQVVATYRAGPVGGQAASVAISAPVAIEGEDVAYPSPQTLIEAVVTDSAVHAFLAAHGTAIAAGCCGFEDGEGTLVAPRGHTFAQLGYLGGVAPEETVGVVLATDEASADVVLDPWTGEVTE